MSMYTGLLIKRKVAFEGKECVTEGGLHSSFVNAAFRYPSRRNRSKMFQNGKTWFLLAYWMTKLVKSMKKACLFEFD